MVRINPTSPLKGETSSVKDIENTLAKQRKAFDQNPYPNWDERKANLIKLRTADENAQSPYGSAIPPCLQPYCPPTARRGGYYQSLELPASTRDHAFDWRIGRR